jgi:chromosome segregation ATPase
VTALARVQRDAEAAIQAAEARAEVAAQEVATLRMQLAQRTGEVDGLREGMQQALTRAERAEREVREVTGELAEQRERVGRAEGEALALRDAVERERELARAAQERAEAIERARAAEAAGGPLARAWRAFLNLRR